MANNITIRGGSLLSQIKADFDVTETIVNEASKDCTYKAARKTKELLKGAPLGGRKYNHGWAIQREEFAAIVYQKAQPTLTHLLEYGHDVIVNGRKVGEARAIPHIEPANEIGKKYFEELIIEEVERRLNG